MNRSDYWPINRKWLLCLACAVGGTAGAQSTPAPANGPVDEVSSIPEIIVTAQRREQRLQDVGISITALDTQALASLNVNNANDLVRVVPGLRMNAYSSSQVVFNIRGVSQNDFGDQEEPPIAVYQDDSYASSLNLTSFPIFDLARAEVLRGPQGTLFGRNATGGAIQFISNKPTKSFEAYGTLTVGRFRKSIVEGAISGPFSDTLQGRFAFVRSKDDGYIQSIFPGDHARGAEDHYALRGQLAWQPSDHSNVSFIAKYMRAPKERQAGLYSLVPACPNANLQGEFTSATETCPYWDGFVGAPGSATGPVGPGTTATGYRNDSITPTFGGNPWRTAETTPSSVDRTISGATLRFDTRFGAVDFVSITDFQRSSKFYIEGGDASPDGGDVFFQGSALKQYSQEFRLSGSWGSHYLVGGLYGLKVDGTYTGKFAIPIFAYDPFMEASQRTRSIAAFFQDEWKISEPLSLTAGVRYWRDKREGSYSASEAGTGVQVVFNDQQVAGLVNGVPIPVDPNFPVLVTPRDASKVFDGVTARLGLNYHITDDVMAFASYNRGSKSGGFVFSTGTPFVFPGSVEAFLNGIPFQPEELNSFEVGIKSKIGRTTIFNATAFYYDYHNYQAYAQLGAQQTIVNRPATAIGMEAELNSQPIPHLTVELGIAAMTSKVKQILLPDLTTVVDHDLPQAPHFTGHALARYDVPTGAGTVSFQADHQYTSRFCFTALCSPDERERAYGVTNVRTAFKAEDGRWEVAAFLDNAFNRAYRVYMFDASTLFGFGGGVYAKPRTWGLVATYRYGAGER